MSKYKFFAFISLSNGVGAFLQPYECKNFVLRPLISLAIKYEMKFTGGDDWPVMCKRYGIPFLFTRHQSKSIVLPKRLPNPLCVAVDAFGHSARLAAGVISSFAPALTPGQNTGFVMKRFFSAFVIFFLVIFLTQADVSSAAPAVPPDSSVGVCSAIVYDLDNDAILFEQNADQKIPPASLTKVLSMFLALDYIKAGHVGLDTPVKISNGAASAGGSSMGLRAGESVPVEKLLLGMAVSSGNDASHAIAETVGGSVPSFVRMMNARARELGMRDSNFVNPHGLPAEGQYTTARDMLAVARAYLKAHPNSLQMHNTRTLTHNGYTSWNKNPLLGQYDGADGLKTGWIRASGYNLIFTASRGSKRLLAVIMGAPDIYSRSGEACRLLDAGFQVCGNDAVSIAAALDNLPFDAKRIDPLKTGREAGLLKKKAVNRRIFVAKRSRAASSNLRCSGLPQPKSVRRNTEASRAKAANAGIGAQKRKTHASRQSARSRRS